MLFKDYVSISVQGSISQGGWTASIVSNDPDSITQYLIISVYITEYWGDPLVADNQLLLLKGQIVPQTLAINWEKSRASAVIATAHDALNLCEIQAVGYAEKPVPANEHQMTTLTLGRIVEHMLDRHTNLVYDASDNPDGWVTLNNLDLTAGDTLTR